jgi:hypothetical protein
MSNNRLPPTGWTSEVVDVRRRSPTQMWAQSSADASLRCATNGYIVSRFVHDETSWDNVGHGAA